MPRPSHATPPAPAPRPSVHPIAGGPSVSAWLSSPVIVVAPSAEYELHRGSLTIGRNPGADIALNDSLVSRMHARIVVLGHDQQVELEDLHSTNGVYVNGIRLGRNSQRLRDGDRLLLGTCEISVFAAPPQHSSASDSRASGAPPPSKRAMRTDGEIERMPATDRADTLQMVGRLAARLYQSGDAAEAIRILSGHLNKVLLGAAAGLEVPEMLLEQASHHAFELFDWTANVAWLDYVIELHLTLRRTPSENSVAALESVGTEARLDSGLLRYFVESFEARQDTLSLHEQARLLRLYALTA